MSFKALAAKLAAEGSRNPNAEAAAIGNRIYGKPTMQQAARRGVSVPTILRQRARGK